MVKRPMYVVLCISFIIFFSYGSALEKSCTKLEPYSQDYMEGYLKAKLDDRFPDVEIQLTLQGDEIIIYRYPQDYLVCTQIRAFLEDQGYPFVRFESDGASISLESTSSSSQPAVEEGNWLPELAPFFPTMLADPRIIGYSAGYRSYDRVFKTALLPVSLGDRFSLYQFKNICNGHLYLGIEAGVWAIFEAKAKSLALINADYYIGVPVTYINQRLSMRLRIYHQSSHLGDELLVEKNFIHRLNPSMEVVDLFTSYALTEDLTVFGGIGRVLRSDDSYHIKPYYFVYAFNYQINEVKLHLGNLEATPYISMYFSNWQDNHWKLNSSVAIGYQWEKSYGRKMRVSLECHDGYSFEGQFSKQKTRYLAVKLIYGY